MENRMNPWMGLSSYRDPQYENTPVMFCGREDEIFDLTRLVMGNIFVTLYGKSGNGKTSLLNAGVFPSLRKSGFIPVSVRLGIDAMDCSFQQAVIRKLRGLASESVVLETSDVVEMPEDESSQDYLWAFFARTRFTDADGRTVFPVIAFDQFEEVFTHRRQDAETLLCQIAFMMDESHALPTREIEGNIYEYDFNFRFIASIREDDLYKLEDSIDNCYLSSLKKCRFRLKALSAKGAREVILKPGAGLFDDADKEAVVEAILDKAKDNTSQGISANMLSLICSRLFEEINRAGAEHISLHTVESFIEANPFEKYFIEATSRLNNYEMKYLEDKLIDEYGRRKSISRKALEKNVRNAEDLINGSRRIMQNVSSASPNGDDLVELVHDTFCGPLVLQKDRRARRRRNKKLILNALGAVFVMVTAGFIALQDKQNKQIKILQSRFVGDKAASIAEEDSYLARKLAVEVLPKDLKHPDRPYTREAEFALRKAASYSSMTLSGHTKSVCSICFSPDGKYVATASCDSTAKIWNVTTGECIKTLSGHTKMLNSVCYSPDGKYVATASDDSTAKIWNVTAGECVKILSGHTDGVSSVRYSPDGKYVVTGSFDTTSKIWDVTSGKCIRTLSGHRNWIRSVVYSPDGQYVVTGSVDETAKIWNVTTGECIKTLSGHTAAIESVACSPDGKCIVTASLDNTARIWNVTTGECIETLSGHQSGVWAVCYSPDGKYVATVSNDCLMIWDATIGRRIKTINRTSEVISLFLPLSYSPDGKYIAIGHESGKFRILNVSIDAPINSFEIDGDISAIACSPDEKCVVTGSLDNAAKIWNVTTGECIKTLIGHTGSISSVSYSPDGEYVVTGSLDNTAKIWNVTTGECIKTLIGHTLSINSVAYSPDGNYVVTASSDSTAKIWNVASGECTMTLLGHNNRINSVRYRPDGKHVVTGSEDNTAKIWNVSSGRCIETITLDSPVKSVGYSSDNKFLNLITSKGDLRVWNVSGQYKKLKYGLNGLNGVNCLIMYIIDSEYCVAYIDNIFGIHSLEYLKSVYKLKIENVKLFAISPSNRTICIYADGKLMFIDFPPLQELINQTRERFKNDPLTAAEKEKYYLE